MTELGLPYDHRIVGGKYKGLDAPEFKALTPVPRVPVLQHGVEVVWESHAILRYLAPKTITTQADIWMEFGSTTLQPPFIGMFWQRVRMTPQQQVKAALAVHVNSLNAGMAILESGMSDGRAYIAGPVFSMADIAIGSLFYRIIDLYPNFFIQYPKVMAWHKTIAARAGYKKWVATSYAELKVS